VHVQGGKLSIQRISKNQVPSLKKSGNRVRMHTRALNLVNVRTRRKFRWGVGGGN